MYKHNDSVKGTEKRVRKDIKHQQIGGKVITLEFGLDLEEVFHLAMSEGNWACVNFLDRRPDVDIHYNQNIYYGKVEGLGYIVSEDELEAI